MGLIQVILISGLVLLLLPKGWAVAIILIVAGLALRRARA